MTKMWVDVETTGLSAQKNGIIQIALLAENEKGKVVDILNIKMKPFKECEYDDTALEINGITREEISEYENESVMFLKIIKFLKRNTKKERFTFCGYNTQFDMKFVRAMFFRNTKVRFDHYFNYYDIDTYSLVKLLDLSGELDGKVCKKLGAICNTMGVEFRGKAHDALVDIRATRMLHKKIVKKYLK